MFSTVLLQRMKETIGPFGWIGRFQRTRRLVDDVASAVGGSCPLGRDVKVRALVAGLSPHPPMVQALTTTAYSMKEPRPVKVKEREVVRLTNSLRPVVLM